MLLGLLSGSCTDDGDELADEAEPVQATDAGSPADHASLDGASDSAAASQDASERCPLRLEYVKGLSDTALPVLLG